MSPRLSAIFVATALAAGSSGASAQSAPAKVETKPGVITTTHYLCLKDGALSSRTSYVSAGASNQELALASQTGTKVWNAMHEWMKPSLVQKDAATIQNEMDHPGDFLAGAYLSGSADTLVTSLTAYLPRSITVTAQEPRIDTTSVAARACNLKPQ